jgi:NADP-dependent 3-hydroxy acid dehydrogenase YdfG
MTVRVDPGAARLAGRVAVVTGASSGIGRAIALRLVAAGTTVIAVGRDKSRLDELPLAAGQDGREPAAGGPGAGEPAADGPDAGGPGAARIIPAQVDLTDDEARSAFVAGVLGGPRVDILVLSAGTYGSGAHADASVGDLDAQYAANVRAPYALTQELLPALRAGGGDLLVVNSTQGVRASGNTGQFAATQHAMRAIADSLRQEVNADGIRVCTIHLGRTATPRQESIFAGEGRSYAPELLVQPTDVADVVATVLGLPSGAEVTEIHLRPAKKSY